MLTNDINMYMNSFYMYLWKSFWSKYAYFWLGLGRVQKAKNPSDQHDRRQITLITTWTDKRYASLWSGLICHLYRMTRKRGIRLFRFQCHALYTIPQYVPWTTTTTSSLKILQTSRSFSVSNDINFPNNVIQFHIPIIKKKLVMWFG